MLRPRSSDRTQLRSHLYLLLRFRDMHVWYRFFPPLWFSSGDIAPIFAHTTGLKKEKSHIKSWTCSRSEHSKKVYQGSIILSKSGWQKSRGNLCALSSPRENDWAGGNWSPPNTAELVGRITSPWGNRIFGGGKRSITNMMWMKIMDKHWI
jgi:hypothetical protein